MKNQLTQFEVVLWSIVGRFVAPLLAPSAPAYPSDTRILSTGYGDSFAKPATTNATWHTHGTEAMKCQFQRIRPV